MDGKEFLTGEWNGLKRLAAPSATQPFRHVSNAGMVSGIFVSDSVIFSGQRGLRRSVAVHAGDGEGWLWGLQP